MSQQGSVKRAHAITSQSNAGRNTGARLVPGLLVVVAAAYVGSVPGQLHVKPDTMVYMGLARSLARGEGYTFNGGPYSKYPPVFPLLLSAAYRVGAQGVAAMQVLVALAGVGAIAAAYALVKARAGWRAALGVAALTAGCAWFWSYSSVYILADVPYACFSLLALWLAERAIRSSRYFAFLWPLAVAAALVALFTHMVGVALVPALAAGVVLARRQTRGVRRRVVAGALAAVVCGGAAVCWVERGRGLPEMATYTGHVAERAARLGHWLDDVKGRLAEYTATPLSLKYDQVAGAVGVAAVGLLILPGLVRGLRRERSCIEFYLVAHLAVSALMGGGTGRERYVLPVVPLLYYYGYLSLQALSEWLIAEVELRRRHRGASVSVPPRWPRRVVVVAAVVVAAYGVAYRVRGRRGGRGFSAKRTREARREEAAWGELAKRVEDTVPARARLCAGSGGSWSIVHYFAERPTHAPIRDDVSPEELLKNIARWGTGLVVSDLRENTQRRLWPALERYRACFPEIARNAAWQQNPGSPAEHGVWKLHRVDWAELARTLAKLRKRDAPTR